MKKTLFILTIIFISAAMLVFVGNCIPFHCSAVISSCEEAPTQVSALQVPVQNLSAVTLKVTTASNDQSKKAADRPSPYLSMTLSFFGDIPSVQHNTAVETEEEKRESDASLVETEEEKQGYDTTSADNEEEKGEDAVLTEVSPSESVAIPSGSVGRLEIPSVGVNVACYASSSQAVTDAEDSAALFKTKNHTVIGDHNNQGFNAIKSCGAGTTAYIHTPSGVAVYKCIDVMTGHNTGDFLTDSDYNNIKNIHPGTLVMYTCNENSCNITLVFFELDEELSTGFVPIVMEPGYNMCDPTPSYSPYNCSEGRHNFGDWTDIDEITKARCCRECGVEETTPVDSDITSPDAEHIHQHQGTRVAPTCQNGGYILYECECGDWYSEYAADALAHEYTTEICSATETTGSYTRYSCVNCGFSYRLYAESSTSDTSPTVHTDDNHCFSDWVVLREATDTEHGSKMRKCDCGEEEYAPIPCP